MFIMTNKETRKRGCTYCADGVRKTKKELAAMGYAKIRATEVLCPFTRCPYTELDEYETYEQYLHEKEGLFYEFTED